MQKTTLTIEFPTNTIFQRLCLWPWH